MSKSLQKNALITELAALTNLERKEVASILDKLAQIAYREAANEFTIPGICKLKVLTKKATRCRNPATGKMLLIGERKILKIIPVAKAKDAITPKTENTIQILPDEPQPAPTPAPDHPATHATEEEQHPFTMPADAIPPLPEPPAHSEPPEEKPPTSHSDSLSMGGEDGQIVFNCLSCRTLLAAPVTSAGETCTCPYCKILNRIPSRDRNTDNTPGTRDGHPDTSASSHQKPAPSQMPGLDFITFVCQTCGQEIEAPIDMMGLDASCPTCASSLHVPESFTPPEPKPNQKSSTAPAPGVNMSSMTIRIDLSDLE